MAKIKIGDEVEVDPVIPYTDKDLQKGTQGTLLEKGSYVSLIKVGEEEKQVFNRDIKPVKNK